MLLKQRKKYSIWVAPIISVALALITLAFYLTKDYATALTSAKIIISALIPSLLPLTEITFKRNFSISVNCLITLHVILSVYLGSAFAFYSLIPWWDLFLHGYFGFVGSAVLLMIFHELNGKMKMFGLCVFVFLSVMGCAAIWEAFEFTTDIIFTQDAQGVNEAISLGLNPIKDTMTDIIITALGAVIFLAGEIIRRFIQKERKNTKNTKIFSELY